MSKHRSVVEEFFRLLERFEIHPEGYVGVLHPEFEQTEFPNALTRATRVRDLAGCYEGMKLAPKMLSTQRYETTRVLEAGDTLVVEARWTGTMAIDAGTMKQGQVLVAYLCMVCEFRDGLLWRQRNYDCYEPWAK